MSLDGLLQELRVEYLETFPAKIALINELWANHDMPAIETEFHKMKGTGRTYGVPEATLVGEAVESICQHSFTDCEPVIHHALRVMAQIYEAHHTNTPFDISNSQDFKAMLQRVQTLTGE